MGGQNALSAKVGGGQAGATLLPVKWNRFDTVASDLDSGLLKAALVGMKQVAFNNTAVTTNKILSVYPQAGEKVNGVANKRCDIPPGLAGIFESFENGNWSFHISSLDNIVFEAKINLSKNQIKSLYASPVDVIPAPGAGFAIELLDGFCEYTYDGSKVGGDPFYTSPNLHLYAETAYGPTTNDYQMSGPQITAPNGGSAPQFSTPYTERNFFVRANASSSYPGNGFQGGKRIIENKKILVTCQSGATTTAAWGTAKINVTYRIVVI